uniref:Uncharacterized protein n=1 Tax=Sexangularia sp. CB-2014 TaxID=1486929 RepID=A0A7S1VS84_9EUKA|mmetsp:Transcript_9064/g.28862  ORF Transcript_9064/g.28862 Transcript_9064/m.28862 type:complete len:185 (-) Transcript_9064:70-624(-)
MIVFFFLFSLSLCCSLSGSYEGDGTVDNSSGWAMSLHLHLNESAQLIRESAATTCVVEAVGTWSANEQANALVFTVATLSSGQLDCASRPFDGHECARNECASTFAWSYSLSANCADLTLNQSKSLHRCPRPDCSTVDPGPPRHVPTGWIVFATLVLVASALGIAFHCHMTKRTRTRVSSYTQL